MRLLVNDYLTCIPNVRTFWHDLREWFDMRFVGGDYRSLAESAEKLAPGASMILRNASYFPVIRTDTPQMCFLQDINLHGPIRQMQEDVLRSCKIVVFNNPFTASKYPVPDEKLRLVPLSIDFDRFVPQGARPEKARICWIGASRGGDGIYKGWPFLKKLISENPSWTFVTVFKDAPEIVGDNQESHCRITHEELVGVIQSCSVALCTSDPNGSPVENQHLAGIEMGACGLPMVAPKVGNYWHRTDMPGVVVNDFQTERFAEAIEHVLRMRWSPTDIHNYWRLEFDRMKIRKKWKELVEETES